MGSVFRKCVTRPIPPTATITAQGGVRVARWRTRSNTWATGEIVSRPDGREVIRVESGTYFAKYRDADDVVHVVPTGCRTEQAALQALVRLERDAERVKLGVVTHGERAIADAASTSIATAIEDYVATFSGSKAHRRNTRSYLLALAKAMHWNRPIEMKREDLERWLADESRPKGDAKQGRSARSRNAYHTAAIAFANWLVNNSRLTSNPFGKIPKANLEADRRRQRRAFTPEELQALMRAAQDAPESPLGRAANKPGQRIKPVLSGRDRAEVYAILAGTGLRVGELGKLRVGDIRLDDRTPHIELPARITKNSQDDSIPLRDELAAIFRRRVQGKAQDALVYAIPHCFLKRFDADCERAGIPKRDGRGRTVDVHSLRTTFGTWLARAGVAPRTAQALMRHSDIRLTMGVYTDPRLLDTAAAVATLPSVAPAASATFCVAPSVAPTEFNSGATHSSPVIRLPKTAAS